MIINKEQCVSLLKEHDNFLILSHEHPDGDTLGCAFALCEILKLLGKKRAFACADEITRDFYYLTDNFVNDEAENPYIVAVDVADRHLLGELSEKYGNKVDLCIDHHMSNTFYAKSTYLEDKSAACEVLYGLLEGLGIQPNRYIRNCIYTGISTDTGCFRYQNTTASTFSVVASLMEKGIDSKLINKLMFETRSKSFLELELMARNTLEYHFGGKCAMMTLKQEMYRKSGSNEHECHAIFSLPREIEGVLVGVILKEKEDGSYGISIRTDGEIDASEICAQMGGGGHRGAAGASFKCSYEEGKARLLEIIEKVL